MCHQYGCRAARVISVVLGARRPPGGCELTAFHIQVGEGLGDDVGIFDAGNDSHSPAAGRAGFHIDVEHTLDALRLVHRGRVILVSAVGERRSGEWCGSAARLWPRPCKNAFVPFNDGQASGRERQRRLRRFFLPRSL